MWASAASVPTTFASSACTCLYPLYRGCSDGGHFLHLHRVRFASVRRAPGHTTVVVAAPIMVCGFVVPLDTSRLQAAPISPKKLDQWMPESVLEEMEALWS